jgi:peptidoglycan/LPS O-acetylase OafA/YrhL
VAEVFVTGGKIYPLTSVRFLAALYVIVEHGRGMVPLLSTGNSYVREFSALGYVAVDFFFVLSGYILATVYLNGKKKLDGKSFWVARFARIYPIYLVALLLDCAHFLHTWLTRHASGTEQAGIFPTLAMNALLLQGWWTRFLGINDPGWSLSTEAFFYAAFPVIGVLLWRLRTRGAWAWAAVLYMVGNAVVLIFAWRHVELATLRYNPASHLYEFLLGILTARLHSIWQQAPSRNARLQRWAPWILAASAGIYLCAVPWVHALPLQLLTHGFFSPVFCAALVALAAGNARIDKIFSMNWLVLLGEASYALYLIHVPILFMLRSRMEKQGGRLFCAYILMCVGLSVLSYLYIERPARRWIQQCWEVRSSAVTMRLTWPDAAEISAEPIQRV